VLRIEIVYAQPQCSLVKSLNLPAGATIADALSLVASDQDFLGVDLGTCAVGIFGRVARKDQQLMDGDRIEIYRPLVEEPKLARRRRVGKSGRQ
jgi:putative ubiquitin-RnfH superfamily antitoxin RatB of RatAB toxin-antitoxin module